MAEKSILEQALLQVQTLEEAVKQNAKGILASTMKEELNELLKEAKEEEEEVKTSPEEEEKVMSDETSVSEEEEEETSGSEEEEETSGSEEEEMSGSEEEDMSGSEEEEETTGSEEEEETSDSMEDEMSHSDEESFGDLDNEEPHKDMDTMDSDDSSMDDVMDMRGASPEEVLKVFKAMKPEDGVIVKKDGDDVSLETGDDEFIIKLDEEEESKLEEDWNESEMEEEESAQDEETVYEIELGEEELGEAKSEEEEASEEEESKKVEATEAARTKSNPHGNKGGADRAGLPSKKKYKAGSGVVGINEEVTKLKKQNDEYRKALVLFKEKLNEVAVFNANLAYATRLFTEHSTTKSEKLNILKRFDSVTTMNESKNLYKTIKTELGTKKPVTESVVEKISNTPTTSSSTEILAESKAYENPQFRRMKDLMAKIK